MYTRQPRPFLPYLTSSSVPSIFSLPWLSSNSPSSSHCSPFHILPTCISPPFLPTYYFTFYHHSTLHPIFHFLLFSIHSFSHTLHLPSLPGTFLSLLRFRISFPSFISLNSLYSFPFSSFFHVPVSLYYHLSFSFFIPFLLLASLILPSLLPPTSTLFPAPFFITSSKFYLKGIRGKLQGTLVEMQKKHSPFLFIFSSWYLIFFS